MSITIEETHPLYSLAMAIQYDRISFLKQIEFYQSENLRKDELIKELGFQIRQPWEVTADKVITAALYADHLNIPYKFGGEWINDKAFDCSSFMLNIFKFAGIRLERGALAQSNQGTEVSYENIRKGDLMFFDINGGTPSINHVGMYIGDGKLIQTNTPTSGINIADVAPGSTWHKRLQKIRRVIE